MANKSLGGAAIGTNPGIPGSFGTNNLGILVVSSGVVTNKSTGCFWIDDGSNIPAEGGRVGVKVISSATVTTGHKYRVLGVSSAYKLGVVVWNVIRTRSAADVTEIL
jgi:hypothetical protein